MTEEPTVVVVVATLGQRPATLGPALQSVRDQAGVTVRLVVVVPAAATAARRCATDHGAVLVDDPGRGLSAAVNAGIAARADAEFYVWLGDDDLLLPGGLRTLAGLLREHPAAAVAFGSCPYIDDAGRSVAHSRAGRLAVALLPWGPDLVPQPASMTRVTDLVAAGPFDEDLRFAMDLDMFLRLRGRGRFVSTSYPTAAFRWHPDSLTVANRGLSLAESERVKRRHLAPALRRWTPVWDVPVRWATTVAARRLNARARAVAAADAAG